MWHDLRIMRALANTMLGLTALMLVSVGLMWLAQRPMFTLQTIRVETLGQRELHHVNKLTIRSTALPKIRGNFFTANLENVRNAFESVPWVRRASVRREWPNQLIVTLEEHEAIGTWGDKGQLLSTKGEVFTANLAEAEEDGGLPEFSGPLGTEKEVLAHFEQFSTWFSAAQLTPESVQLSSRYAWSVRLNNGMNVELGREQDKEMLKIRVQRFISVYPQLLVRLKDQIEGVDLRYPNGLALKSVSLDAALDSQQAKKKKFPRR